MRNTARRVELSPKDANLYTTMLSTPPNTHRLVPNQLSIAISVLLLSLAMITGCGSDEQSSSTANTDDQNSGEPDTGGDDVTSQAAGSSTSLSLAGTWILDSLVVDGEAVELPVQPISITIELGRIDGMAGCNSFGGTIDRGDDGSLSISALSATEMACDELPFEMVYLPLLPTATNWAGGPDGISISGPTFTASYVLGQDPIAAPISGTVWQLATIFNGEGVERAASSVDQSQTPTLLVIDTTTATLSGPCSVTIDVDYDNASTSDGPFSATLREGSQQQGCSQDFLRALDGLDQASGYMIDGQQLTFIGLAGETVGFVNSEGS